MKISNSVLTFSRKQKIMVFIFLIIFCTLILHWCCIFSRSSDTIYLEDYSISDATIWQGVGTSITFAKRKLDWNLSKQYFDHYHTNLLIKINTWWLQVLWYLILKRTYIRKLIMFFVIHVSHKYSFGNVVAASVYFSHLYNQISCIHVHVHVFHSIKRNDTCTYVYPGDVHVV